MKLALLERLIKPANPGEMTVSQASQYTVDDENLVHERKDFLGKWAWLSRMVLGP